MNYTSEMTAAYEDNSTMPLLIETSAEATQENSKTKEESDPICKCPSPIYNAESLSLLLPYMHHSTVFKPAQPLSYYEHNTTDDGDQELSTWEPPQIIPTKA